MSWSVPLGEGTLHTKARTQCKRKPGENSSREVQRACRSGARAASLCLLVHWREFFLWEFHNFSTPQLSVQVGLNGWKERLLIHRHNFTFQKDCLWMLFLEIVLWYSGPFSRCLPERKRKNCWTTCAYHEESWDSVGMKINKTWLQWPWDTLSLSSEMSVCNLNYHLNIKKTHNTAENLAVEHSKETCEVWYCTLQTLKVIRKKSGPIAD